MRLKPVEESAVDLIIVHNYLETLEYRQHCLAAISDNQVTCKLLLSLAKVLG